MPGITQSVVDERLLAKSSSLAKEDPDGGAVRDRFGIELRS
ncbi:MAG TPA: hypothetical protein VGR34_05980 [Candidatus Dormibacteraeota bacterium]|nr:hypothetical protein [Candidatus Dormibacteraeota bacterium]